MEAWKTAIHQVLLRLTGNPATTLEFWVIVILTGVVGLATLISMLKTLSDHGQGIVASLLVGSLGMALTVVALAACLRFLPPAWSREMAETWFVLVPLLLAGLILSVPFICLVWHYGYVEVLFSWIAAVFMAALVVIITGGAFELLDSSSQNTNRMQQYRHNTEESMR